MAKDAMTEVCVDVGMHGMFPVTYRDFTGAKSKVQCLLKLVKIYLCSSKIMSHLKHNGGHTHTFKVSYFQHMPYLPSMSALGPPGTEASWIKFWVKLPHHRGIYSHRERVRDRYSEFSCQNTSTLPPVIQFCCCSLRVTKRTQGLLELFSSFSSLPSPWKLLTTFSLVLPLIPSGHAHCSVCALKSS